MGNRALLRYTAYEPNTKYPVAAFPFFRKSSYSYINLHQVLMQ